MSEELWQIGEVAEATGISHRTIRHYEEVGLVVPTRTTGGFRLYGEAEVARLRLIRQMKPLGFTLADMAELLEARALGLSRNTAYRLVQREEFPCRVIKAGDTYRVPTIELLVLIGVDRENVRSAFGSSA
jgi:DNA-binding transcriptional MerR regulator